MKNPIAKFTISIFLTILLTAIFIMRLESPSYTDIIISAVISLLISLALTFSGKYIFEIIGAALQHW